MARTFFVGFVVFIALANDEYVAYGESFDSTRRESFLRVQTGRNGVVGVDAGQVRVIERTGNLSGIEFDELEIFRISRNVRYRSVYRVAVLQGNQAGLLEQEKSPGTVGRVVRNRNFGAVGDVFEIFIFMGINGHGQDNRLADGNEL